MTVLFQKVSLRTVIVRLIQASVKVNLALFFIAMICKTVMSSLVMIVIVNTVRIFIVAPMKCQVIAVQTFIMSPTRMIVT